VSPISTTVSQLLLQNIALLCRFRPGVRLVPFQFEGDQCHFDRREESGDGWNGPAPDASPLRLAQHDIFGGITGV